MPLLEMRQVVRTYQRGPQAVPALRGVDLSIEKGEFLAIVGPSGSGKTTLLNLVGCLDLPTGGSLRYNDTELSGMDEERLSAWRRSYMAFIFQSYNLIPVLSVRENVELPLVLERKASKEEMKQRATELLTLVGLGSMIERKPTELSGGQEQRVAIARALVKDPLLVLADEPTANLDSHTAEEIISVMQEMNQKRQTTFVFSTHDPLVMRHARRVITLRDGLIVNDERRA